MTPEQVDAPRLPPAYRLIALDRVESTNDEARRRAEEGADDGALVWAREQTKARGRYGRSFDSPRGNLGFSLVLRPDCDVATAAELGFVAALAVKDGIGSVAPPLVDVTFKWPNDVLLNGRKGVGILLESKTTADGVLEWLILGVGVNVAHYPEDSKFPATSLRFEGCPPEVSDVAVLEGFARHFMTWADRWLNDGFAPIRRAWLDHAEGKGEAITVRLPRESFAGTFADLDEAGALLVDLPGGGRRRVTAGDVYFEL
jgi:BirA family biotin operon repressor/biotin-[acetyl-CoA-carboxylase] ligase